MPIEGKYEGCIVRARRSDKGISLWGKSEIGQEIDFIKKIDALTRRRLSTYNTSAEQTNRLRAGHFRYFLIFSIIRNDFLHFVSS